MLPHVLFRVGAVGHRMGRTQGSHQPGQAWVYWHRRGLSSACGHPRANVLHPHSYLQTTPFPSSLASGAADCLAAPSPQVGTACTSPRGTLWRFLWRDGTWKQAQALPDPPLSTHRCPSCPCHTPASQDASSYRTSQHSLAGSDLSIILYPHAFNFYSPVGAIPRTVNNASPPFLCASIMLPPRCQARLGPGKCRNGEAGVWHPALCPHPPANPPKVGGKVGHPVLTHEAACVQVPLHLASQGAQGRGVSLVGFREPFCPGMCPRNVLLQCPSM